MSGRRYPRSVARPHEVSCTRTSGRCSLRRGRNRVCCRLRGPDRRHPGRGHPLRRGRRGINDSACRTSQDRCAGPPTEGAAHPAHSPLQTNLPRISRRGRFFDFIDALVDPRKLFTQQPGLRPQFGQLLWLHRRRPEAVAGTRPTGQPRRVVHVAPTAAPAAIAQPQTAPGRRMGEPRSIIAAAPAGPAAGHRSGPHRSCAISSWHDSHPFLNAMTIFTGHRS